MGFEFLIINVFSMFYFLITIHDDVIMNLICATINFLYHIPQVQNFRNFLESNNGYFSPNDTELGNIENSGFNGSAFLDTNLCQMLV